MRASGTMSITDARRLLAPNSGTMRAASRKLARRCLRGMHGPEQLPGCPRFRSARRPGTVPPSPRTPLAVGMAIEEMERPAAAERMQEGRRLGAAVTNRSVPPVAQSDQEGYRSRDIAAEAVGLTRGTYQNIKTAIVASENESEPNEVREVARDVLDRIDRGEPIRPNVERIKTARQQGSAPPEPTPVETTKRASDPRADTPRLSPRLTPPAHPGPAPPTPAPSGIASVLPLAVRAGLGGT